MGESDAGLMTVMMNPSSEYQIKNPFADDIKPSYCSGSFKILFLSNPSKYFSAPWFLKLTHNL
jgi:hypothetical protein